MSGDSRGESMKTEAKIRERIQMKFLEEIPGHERIETLEKIAAMSRWDFALEFQGGILNLYRVKVMR